MSAPRVVTFVDSGVLIAAARGLDEIAARALEILDDPPRLFVSSIFVRLEVVPKAVFHRKREEADLYRAFFRDGGLRDVATVFSEILAPCFHKIPHGKIRNYVPCAAPARRRT